MARDKAYREAERKIKEACRTRATELDLSCYFFSHGSVRLTELPESLGQLTQLQTLNLSHNQLTALPESVGQLTQLQRLDLGGNQLTALPESLGRLTQLRSLNLTANQLTALRESLGQLTQLQRLDLSRNQLTALPESLGQLTQLQTLDLSNNQLKAVPESLGLLETLQILSLSRNKLRVLPESIGNLSDISELNLNENQLTELPESIGHLSTLRDLRFYRNNLSDLPLSLGNLRELKELWLNGNAGLSLPIEVRQQSPARKLEYYFATRAGLGSALRELKLLVVGRGGVGKTSLIKRLNGEALDRGESETHGINISPLKLKCSDGPVTARVWDFGGQHVLHAMHEFFLTARSLYLLVLGEREDMAERDAAYWLQLIRSYAPSAPVIVALNKNEGRAREMDRESLGRQYGPILAWVPTECSDGFDGTIESLRIALTDAADKMPEVRDLFPKKWWDVKEWLENMNEPYLDFATYQQKCFELGEHDEKDQERLAAWLNDLGVCPDTSFDLVFPG